MKNHVLSILSMGVFEELLVEASDYETKMKNNEQDRIFSYDKPNKYRSDISNIVYCLLNNPLILAERRNLTEVMARVFLNARVALPMAEGCVQKYADDIINRNEVLLYSFSSSSKP